MVEGVGLETDELIVLPVFLEIQRRVMEVLVGDWTGSGMYRLVQVCC